MSDQGAFPEAAAGSSIGTSLPWKRIVFVPSRWSVNRVCNRQKTKPPPAESPAKTILEAGTGSWKEPGGGERSVR